MVSIPPDQIWMVVVGFIIAFILAFGIGANDVANSFGTSVGAKVLSLKQACILASIFETLGAILLGAKVSDTIRKGIIDVEPYQNDTSLLMMGNVAALSGSCIWLMGATLLRLPVSATHSIVGATVGFALVAHGARGIHWGKLGMIIGSWFISPVTAGLVSTLIFFFCKYFILGKADPLEPGLRFLPAFYACTIIINLFSVFYDGPEMLRFDLIPLWGTFILSFGTGIIVGIVVRLVVVPWQRNRIKKECMESESGYYSPPNDERQMEGEVKFSFEGDQTKVVSSKDSANSSPSSSRDISARNSMEISEKVPLNDLPNTAVSTQELENKENCKNAANNLTVPVVTVNGILKTTNMANGTEKKSCLKNGKIHMNKDEDAPLMDNEHNLGNSTPVKSPTAEDLKKLDKGFNGTSVKIVAAGESQQSIDETSLDRGRSSVVDRPETAKLFSFLQILTAVLGAFAHGGNDVSNAIGPLISLWLIGSTGVVSEKASTPIWILFYGGLGISIGLWAWGRRVIKTIGEDLTRITPSSGFCIEIGSALTVLVASNIGIPISTTHCKVGSVVFVGRFRARENVDWSIFRNIVLAWLVTLPVTGGISAAIMAALMKLV